MPRMYSPVLPTFYLIWLVLPSCYCIASEIPLDEKDAFYQLADEQKRVCYRHKTCQSIYESHMGSQPAKEITGSTDCVSADCSCCGSCTCDASCVRYGCCCLDAYADFDHALESTQNNRYGCILAQYLPNQDSDFDGKEFRYWMITKCDPGYQNHEEQDLCEKPGLYASPDSIVPVTDFRSNVHYRNKYCYHCNEVGNEATVVSWALKIVNNESISIPNQNLLGEIKSQRGNIFFRPPSYVDVQQCNVPPYKISACNQTGLWKTYNKYIETACNSVLDPFNYTYKNYYCYLCNIAESLPEDNWICRFNRTQGGDTVNPPFLAILDLNAVKGEIQSNQLHCDNYQFKDEIMMTCRDVLCTKDRRLQHGACLINSATVTNSTNSTCFSAFIRMTPLAISTYKDNEDDVRMIMKHMRRNLTAKLSICENIELEFIFFTNTDELRNIKYLVVFILAYIPVNAIDCYYDVYIDKLVALHSDNIIVKDYLNRSINFSLEAAVYNITFTSSHAYLFVPNEFDSTTKKLGTFFWLFENPCDVTNLTQINKLSSCPFVILGEDEISMTVENEFLFLANIETPNKTLKTLARWQYEVHGDQISICLEDFIELYSIMVESQSDLSEHLSLQTLDNLKHDLALACVSLSIVCLFVTVVTYLTHSSLHSQPGINNVILCIFLLLAQTVYQFGAGQTSLPDSACSLIGATCHFLWLSVMFSMNFCCIQMFIIFKNQTKSSLMFESWQTLKHVLFVTCSSLLFVLINMVISLVSSDGVSIGYGGKICYLSSNLMQIITFVVPSAVTLVANLIVFAYVVYNIKKVSSAKLLQKDRSYLGVYVRLSTLTGLTWIFGFCRLVFETDVLEYMFIVFNASQGVFLMIAFVLNRRVLSLICRKDGVTSS